MPKYDFSCLNCDTTVELEFGFNETPRPQCEKCGEFLNRVYTAPAAHFKGGGWGGQ